MFFSFPVAQISVTHNDIVICTKKLHNTRRKKKFQKYFCHQSFVPTWGAISLVGAITTVIVKIAPPTFWNTASVITSELIGPTSSITWKKCSENITLLNWFQIGYVLFITILSSCDDNTARENLCNDIGWKRTTFFCIALK